MGEERRRCRQDMRGHRLLSRFAEQSTILGSVPYLDAAAHPAERHTLPPRMSYVAGPSRTNLRGKSGWVGVGKERRRCRQDVRGHRPLGTPRDNRAWGLPVSPTGRTPVLSGWRVLRPASILTRHLAFRQAGIRWPRRFLPPVEARHRNRGEKASSIGAVRLSSGGFFAGTHRVPSRARLL